MTQNEYFCIRDNEYVPCIVLGRGYGDYDHERRGAIQYYVGALDGAWSDYIPDLYTRREIMAESIANCLSDDLPKLVFLACIFPLCAQAICVTLHDDPRLLTEAMLTTLRDEAAGTVACHLAMRELDRRTEETEMSNV